MMPEPESGKRERETAPRSREVLGWAASWSRHMEAYQVRVIQEAAELNDKRTKLAAFIGTEIFAKLTKEEQHRMERQCGIMNAYAEVLGERISAF